MIQIKAMPSRTCEKFAMKTLLTALFLIFIAVAASAADPIEGRKLAERWCADCHDIDGKTATDRVPGWRQIVNERNRSTEYIRSFLTHPHGEMPPLQLSRHEIDDLLAYIGSLKAQ